MPLPLFPLYQVSHSCSCGLHKQTARAQGRSSAAPPIVGAFVPQASALRRARALSTGSSHGRGSMRRLAPRSVSQTPPPQHRAPPDTDSRRHGLSNSAAPAARKRAASAPLLVSMYFSPFSPTFSHRFRQRTSTVCANVLSPLLVSSRRPFRRLLRSTRPSACTTCRLS